MMMKSVIALVTGSLMLAAGGAPASAQTAGQQSGRPGMSPPPAGSPTQEQPWDPSAPNPRTGVVQPPPGPPPEGTAADIKLPDCAPPNCGTPRIME